MKGKESKVGHWHLIKPRPEENQKVLSELGCLFEGDAGSTSLGINDAPQISMQRQEARGVPSLRVPLGSHPKAAGAAQHPPREQLRPHRCGLQPKKCAGKWEHAVLHAVRPQHKQTPLPFEFLFPKYMKA